MIFPERVEIQDCLEFIRDSVKRRLLTREGTVYHGGNAFGSVAESLRELARLCIDGFGPGQLYVASKATGKQAAVRSLHLDDYGDGPVLVMSVDEGDME